MEGSAQMGVLIDTGLSSPDGNIKQGGVILHQPHIGIAVCLVTFCLAGCHSYKVQPMPQVGVHEAPVRTSASGIAFGAKSYNNAAECKAVFNQSLPARGVIPVLLMVENRGSDDIEILRAACELETPSGSVLRPIGADSASSQHGRNAMAEAVLLFGIFSYDNANRFNDAMARDWVEKGMGEVQIVRSGRSMARFLYFETGSDFATSGSSLRVPFEHLGGSRMRPVATLRFLD